jgi:hypothetical protein
MGKYLCILLLVGVFSCKKDKTPFPLEPAYNDLEHGWYTEDCSNSWPDHWVDSFNMNSYYVDDHVVFKTPQFNPNNPDEIVYYHINYPENKRQLVKYNLKTTEKLVLTDGLTINNEPSWGRNGWISFSTLPSRILYKVKDNGNELSLFSNNQSGIYPTWSPSENSVLYTFLHSPSLRSLFRYNTSTEIIDTIIFQNQPYNFSHKTTISLQGKILMKANMLESSYFAFADLENPDFNLSPILDFMNFPAGNTDHFCWSHDSQFIYLAYYATGDIYRVHVETGQIEQLRSDCFGRWLHSIDASPDGKYLVVEKVNLRFTILPNGWASSAVRMQSHITLIDLQTGQMKDLDLE